MALEAELSSGTISGEISSGGVLKGALTSAAINGEIESTMVVDPYLITLQRVGGGGKITARKGTQVQEMTIYDASAEGCVRTHQGVENVGKIMKVDANGDLALSPFYSIVANEQGGNTLTL